MATRRTDLSPLVELACLAHTVPGVTLRVWNAAGRDVLVSRGCLGADLDPCQLRAALLAGHGAGITRVEVVGGVTPLGGGLYQRHHPGAADERWFVTSLTPEEVIPVLADQDGPDAVSVVIRPDPALGTCAVCVSAERGTPALALDEAAVRVVGAVLVGELLAPLAAAPAHPSTNRE